MDLLFEKALLALVGATGVVGGAVIAALANIYSARLKTKEIEPAYRQKLNDNYLENARKMTAQVYVPLNIAITDLSNSYERFRARVDFDSPGSSSSFKNDFEDGCLNYLQLTEDLMRRGADAYLTFTLDETIRLFNSFLHASLDAKDVRSQVLLESGLSFGGVGIQFPKIAKVTLLKSPVGRARLNFGGVTLQYNTRIVAAPLDSREFERRFQGDLAAMRNLIKEVTLGAKDG